MTLDGDSGRLELERSKVGTSTVAVDDDVLLNVSVSVRGYSAADQSWIVAHDWSNFLAQLAALEKSRRGRALVLGASPDDFELEIYSTDSAGHMAARGHVGWKPEDSHLLQLKFGFHFEPDRLPKLVRDLMAL